VLNGICQDTRFALRMLRRQRAFATIAVLTLAVGIGANIAIITVGDAVLLRPLPYPDADRLVAVRYSPVSSTSDTGLASVLDLAEWQARATSFEAIAGYRMRTIDLTGGASSERLRGLWVTSDFFKVFGLTNLRGRSFIPGDRAANTIVLGRGVWERRFRADPTLVGSMLDINVNNLSREGATPYLVLGVVPADVHFPPLTTNYNRGAVTQMTVPGVDNQVDFWEPLFPQENERRDNRALDVVAKLRQGVTVEQAQAEMDIISRAVAAEFPVTNRNWYAHVVPLRSHILGRTRRVVLWLSLATVLVLVIACGNVSTLLLSGGLARQHEVVVRAALGASRVRIARQFLIESLVIALAAAGLGLYVASVGIRLLARWLPADIPLVRGAGVNGFVLASAVLLAVIAASLTGVAPAWMATAREAAATLNVRRQSAGRRHDRTVSLLVAAQAALTIVLLVSTGLLFTSAAHLLKVEPGFVSHDLLTMTISLPNNMFEWRHSVIFYRDVVNAVKANPVVTDAAVIQGVPMRPGGFPTTFLVEGMSASDIADRPVVRQQVISGDYFRVMQIPLLEGRSFDERDNIGELGRPQFIIVNHALAARFWPGQSAIGRRLQLGPGWFPVAGVVGDVRYEGLDTPPGFEAYLPIGVFPQSAITLLMKTSTNPATIIDDVRARILGINREAFITDVRTMDELIGDSLSSRWFATVLLAVCATIGLLLALSGIYSIVTQAVVQRQFEIGVRMALGATPRAVVRLMRRRSVIPVAAGAAVGLVVMMATARLLSAMLFETGPLDPMTFIGATVLFVLVAFIAASVPARRATKVDPLIALRCE
jgi:putative ABC transport system permease protein